MTEALAFRVGEMRERIAEAQGWRCEGCGGEFTHGVFLAHRIPKAKHFLAAYGPAVIHHRFNLAGVCSLDCNSSVLIGGDPEKIKALVHEIRADLGLTG